MTIGKSAPELSTTTYHSDCYFSVDLADRITAGRGRLLWNGEWEFPCDECAERAQKWHDEAEAMIMEMYANGTR